MTSLLTITPLDAEPLPLYSRRDPDSVSILSSAPSYVSEAPTYTSEHHAPPSSTPTTATATTSLPPLLPPLRPDEQVGRGLPAPRYAPGFQNRAGASNLMAMTFTHHFATANNARQYQSVARRRANTQHANTTALLTSAVPSPSLSPSSSTATPTTPTATSPPHPTSPTTPLPQPTTAYPVRVGSSADPLHPLEDPYLVGEEAAVRARQQRVYREMCLRGDEAAGYESRSWDFMMGQMSDWEERSRSWRGFRRSVGNGNVRSGGGGSVGRRLVGRVR